MSGESITKVQERVDRWGVANLPSIIPDEEIGLLKEMSDFVEKVGTRRQPKHDITQQNFEL